MNNYQTKYLKYKEKYLELKNMLGGAYVGILPARAYSEMRPTRAYSDMRLKRAYSEPPYTRSFSDMLPTSSELAIQPSRESSVFSNASSSSSYLEFSDNESVDEQYDEPNWSLIDLKNRLFRNYYLQKDNILMNAEKMKEIEEKYGEQIKEIIKNNIYFHATLFENCTSILAEGIIPFYQEATRGLTRFKGQRLQDEEVREHVYVTSIMPIAQYYGRRLEAQSKKNHIILGILIPDSEKYLLSIDTETTVEEGQSVTAFKYKGMIPHDHIFNPLITPFEDKNLITDFISMELGLSRPDPFINLYIMNEYFNIYLKSNFDIKLPSNPDAKHEDMLVQLNCP
jgi:hypothetical protein